MRIGMVVPELTDEKLGLIRQIGVEEICTSPSRKGRAPGAWAFEEIVQLKERIEDAGLNWSVVETLGVPDRVKLGEDGRDEDIDHIRQSLRNLGAAGITTVVYTWTAVFNWLRTSTDTPVRGGALATSYDHALMQSRPQVPEAPIAEQSLWEGLTYFLRAVVPIAEEWGVRLAMHPDDPPLSPVRGVGRIMVNASNYQRMFDLVPSVANGMTFCQGCFSEMGVDVSATLKSFIAQDRVYFAHFRNLRGRVAKFTEQFHDDGDVDMFAVMRAFYKAGYKRVMRPDHVPVMEGEGREHPGYTLMGKLFAVGYMRGLMEGVEKVLSQ